MRIQRILVGAALLMLCAAAAYAQVSVSSTPVTTVIASGRAENAGAIRISGTGGVAIPVADTITIRYGGLSITNALTTAVNISGPWACTWVSTDLVNGIVTISCPAAVASTDYFTLSGVRLNIDGYAGANVVASVGTLNNPVIAGQNTAQSTVHVPPAYPWSPRFPAPDPVESPCAARSPTSPDTRRPARIGYTPPSRPASGSARSAPRR